MVLTLADAQIGLEDPEGLGACTGGLREHGQLMIGRG